MRLEFRLKKKSKRRWKLKVLIGVMIMACGMGLALSPIGKKIGLGVQRGWHQVTERAHWQLDQVVVEGHKRTDKAALMKVLHIQQGQKMNTISLNEVRQKLLHLPWIKEAVVERHLPDKLVIRITEKVPVALWQNNQVYQPLDEKGNPIRDDKLLPSNLILVVGPDAPEHTLSLLAALEKVPRVSALTRSAVRVERRRWNLHLLDAETGLEVMLPEVDFEAALKRLEYQDQQENLLKKNLQAIDMRLKDRIIVHPKKSLLSKGKK